MTIEDKLAVLKFVGYKIHSHRFYSRGGRIWDWSKDDDESASYSATRGSAINDAWQHLQETHQKKL